MPTGLQVMLGGTATTQITNEDVYFSLFSKGILTNQLSWAQEGNNSSVYELTINGVTADDEPMLALRCAGGTWAELASSTPNSVKYLIYRVGTADVLWYLFTAKSPAAITDGLELYDIDGNVIFNSGHPIARPLGTFSNDGYSGLDLTGRTLAHVPMKMGATAYRFFTHGSLGSCMSGGAYPGYQTYQTEGWQRSAIAINNQTIAMEAREQRLGPYPYACLLNPPLTGMNNFQSLDYSSLILDVTYY
ncbi:hypothetical protein JYB87_12820 [Shewanella avicenniae]|uniref:Uncharacterized protein n=1 Tax=Shewanella avicenniae TaxID=2814294 RepID=A0ABX7QPJ1_9GAMM|nr:hypothetical protein [Shewanella avicenniae]QSX32631.1 hypothetical protein JYB87_12820 [Shewanella avicenniae]